MISSILNAPPRHTKNTFLYVCGRREKSAQIVPWFWCVQIDADNTTYVYIYHANIGGTDLVRTCVRAQKRARARGKEFFFSAYTCGSKNYAIGDSRMCIFVRIKISCAPINKTHQLDCAQNVEESCGGSGKTAATISQLNQKQNKKNSSSYISCHLKLKLRRWHVSVAVFGLLDLLRWCSQSLFI